MTGAVLLTGATGRIGAAVLSTAGSRAVIPVVRTGDARSGAEPLDLESADAVAACVEAVRPRAIVHLASVLPGGPGDPAFNVRSTAALATVAAEFGCRMILASTAGVYGDSVRTALDEQTPFDARSDYARSKVDAEAAVTQSGADYAVLRIFNVYGKGFHDSLVNRLLASTPESPTALRGLDDFVRDYVHVRDVATAVWAAVDRSGPAPLIANIGSGRATSNRQLVEQLSDIRRLHTVQTTGAPSSSVADIGVARRELSFAPSADILATVKETGLA